jgi:erythromycin esterase-like protein
VNLAALTAVTDGARVVAIGETARHVPGEMVEILVQKAGFTVVTMESGFPEGLALDTWLSGAPGPFPACVPTPSPPSPPTARCPRPTANT